MGRLLAGQWAPSNHTVSQEMRHFGERVTTYKMIVPCASLVQQHLGHRTDVRDGEPAPAANAILRAGAHSSLDVDGLSSSVPTGPGEIDNGFGERGAPIRPHRILGGTASVLKARHAPKEILGGDQRSRRVCAEIPPPPVTIGSSMGTLDGGHPLGRRGTRRLQGRAKVPISPPNPACERYAAR